MYGIEDKFLAIIYSSMMLALAVGVRMTAGTFLVPAGIFSIAWFLFTCAPLVGLFSTPINSLAILYILAAAFAFSLSSFAFNWRRALRVNRKKSVSSANFDSPFLRITLYISSAASASLSILTMLINGFTLDQVVFDLIRTSGQYAETRSSAGVEYGVIGVLSIMFTYLAPVLGGLRSLAPHSKRTFMVAMAPCLLTMITQSSKLVFLVGLCFYFAGALVAKIYANQLDLPKGSGLWKAIVGAAILSGLILISFVSRLGEFDPDNLAAVTDPLVFSVASYTLGQTYAFADFFSYTIGYPSTTSFKDDYHSYGAYTFASIFDMLSIGKNFPPGMYEESTGYSSLFETNIFTFFRGLIYDFGLIGSLVFLHIFGVAANAITYRCLTKTRSWLSLSILIAIVVFILMGYLFSVFVARYVFLVAAVTWVLLKLNAEFSRTPLNVRHSPRPSPPDASAAA